MKPDVVIVAVCGSRGYPAEGEARGVLQYTFAPPTEAAPRKSMLVVTGGAAGPDTWAREEAEEAGLNYATIPPLWDVHGRRAGFVRNSWIVILATHVIAFWDGTSRGTADTIEKARKLGKPVLVFGPDGKLHETINASKD